MLREEQRWDREQIPEPGSRPFLKPLSDAWVPSIFLCIHENSSWVLIHGAISLTSATPINIIGIQCSVKAYSVDWKPRNLPGIYRTTRRGHSLLCLCHCTLNSYYFLKSSSKLSHYLNRDLLSSKKITCEDIKKVGDVFKGCGEGLRWRWILEK